VETIARAYAGRHQVANAIADDRAAMPFYDNEEAEEPSGVEMIHSIDGQGVDTSGNHNGLRYKKPDISGLDIMADFLSQQELEVL
jgi:hypothetical protein